MRTPAGQLRHRRRRAQAFTLVELVTAAAIMSLVMLGVVEIFSIVTRTAADAEAIQGASQQMRAALDRLNRDIRGMSREGPLRVSTAEPAGDNASDLYHSDVLNFVTIGQTYGTYSTTSVADAAEVKYTTYVKTPSAFLTIDGQPVDYRRGVLARSAQLMSGTTGTADSSAVAWLGNLLGNPGLAYSTGPAEVTPFLADSGASPDESVRRVLATGASEFCIECYAWKCPDKNHSQLFLGPGSCTTCSKTLTAGWYNQTAPFTGARPKGLRVTLAVHDPAERGPPTRSDGRYEGYVLQEVFCLGAP